MNCQYCGASVSADATACPDCGANLGGASDAGGQSHETGGQSHETGGEAGTPDGQPDDPGGQPGDPGEEPPRNARGSEQQGRAGFGSEQGQQPPGQQQQPTGQPPGQQQQPTGQPPGQQQQPTGQRPGQQPQRAEQPPAGGSRGGRQAGRAPPAGRESSGSSVGGLVNSWGITRFGAIGGGVLAGFSVTLSWVEAEVGGVSADAMATVFGPVVAIAAAVAVLAAVSNWGRGWGWLSMILTGLAGVAVAGTGWFAQTYLSETTTLNTVEVEGRNVPVAAVEPGGGVEMAMLAGGVIAVAALAGIVGTLANR